MTFGVDAAGLGHRKESGAVTVAERLAVELGGRLGGLNAVEVRGVVEPGDRDRCTAFDLAADIEISGLPEGTRQARGAFVAARIVVCGKLDLAFEFGGAGELGDRR